MGWVQKNVRKMQKLNLSWNLTTPEPITNWFEIFSYHLKKVSNNFLIVSVFLKFQVNFPMLLKSSNYLVAGINWHDTYPALSLPRTPLSLSDSCCWTCIRYLWFSLIIFTHPTNIIVHEYFFCASHKKQRQKNEVS